MVTDCAVIGIPDEEWGEIVAVGLVIEGDDLNEEELRAWASERLAGYKIPRLIKVIPDLPRNAMGANLSELKRTGLAGTVETSSILPTST